MIIVKTKNGDRFINDKAVAMVAHDRDKAVVNAHGENGAYYHIEDVEGIIYTNDAQPTSWKDEGSEIQRLKKELDEQREWADKMRYEHLQMMQERDELKERLTQLEPKPAADYANDRLIDKVYHEIDRLDIQEREENKKNYPDWGAFQKNGNAVRFMNVAKDHNIETVGQLLEVGSARFKQFRNMGSLCINRISEALDNLYGIKSW